jgi:hypothetical protein
MALYTLIALTAVVAGGTAQDPSMDLQIAAPVLTSDQVYGTAVTTTAPAQHQGNKVTAQFRNSKASEVLEWMEKRGVSFVVNDGDIKPDAKVTLSVTDVPLESVLDALAAALGGHWERRDKIRVFHKGQGFATVYGNTNLNSLHRLAPGTAMTMEVPAQGFMKFEGKAFDKDFEKRMKEMSAEMEKKFGPEFQKKFHENMKDFQAFSHQDGAKFRALQGKELEEALKMSEGDRKAAMKEAEQARKEAMKMAEEARKMAGEARKEAMKDAERARAEAQKARVEALKSREISGRAFTTDTRVYRVAPGIRDGRRTFITPSFPVDGMDMGKFLKSLSSSQKDTQEKRGFIRYNDLTREQKHLLGVRPSGKFEIRLKVNQDEVVVRGE